jgi:hypothetical protein
MPTPVPPAPDCIEAQITANLKTALRAITIANGYSWTPGAVEEPRLNLSINNRYPYVLLTKTNAPSETENNQSTEEKIRYLITLIDVGNDEDQTQDGELTYTNRNKKADIIKAVMVDHTRGGLAETTRVIDKDDGVAKDNDGAFYYAYVEIEVQALIDSVNPYLKG